ncbi:MAG: hypothetical protein Kow0069_09880 [Promethearchaeota archaeon]
MLSDASHGDVATGRLLSFAAEAKIVRAQEVALYALIALGLALSFVALMWWTKLVLAS